MLTLFDAVYPKPKLSITVHRRYDAVPHLSHLHEYDWNLPHRFRFDRSSLTTPTSNERPAVSQLLSSPNIAPRRADNMRTYDARSWPFFPSKNAVKSSFGHRWWPQREALCDEHGPVAMAEDPTLLDSKPAGGSTREVRTR
jgi:hypothetical protein